MNLTVRKESFGNETVYPIIQDNKNIRNKFLNDNAIKTMKSLKNKTVFNYFNNKNKKTKNNNQSKTKSLKVIKRENKYFKIEKFMDKKIHNFSKKNNHKYIDKNKNEKKGANNSIFNINDEVKENTTNEINCILNELFKIKQKINRINDAKNKKIKNFTRYLKSENKIMENNPKSISQKEEFLKAIDKTKETKYRLKLLNNKSNNFGNVNQDENKIENYKTENNFNNLNSRNNKNEISKNSDVSSISNKKIKLKLLSLDEIDKEKNSEINSSIKNISKSLDKKYISYNYNNIISEQTGEINYIDKIRDKQFISLYNKFKKSMKKNKKEEIYHRKSLVFPPETVNYIIKKKNELIIDKYRYEYLKIFDNYKYNKEKFLKVIKKCKKTEIKNMEISENNIDNNINSQKNNGINENDKINNNINNHDDDKFNFILSDKEYFEIF